MAAAGQEKPLRTLVEVFQGLMDGVNTGGGGNPPRPRIEVSQLVLAMRLGCQFVLCFGNDFQFVMMEIQEKADRFEEASRSSNTNTIQALVQLDISKGQARVNWSNSRYLVRTKRAMEFLRVFFQQILATRGNSLLDPFTTAYTQVPGPYHGSVLKDIFLASLEDFVTKSQLFRLLNEDEDSAKDLMQKYIVAANVVIPYIDSLFLSTEIGQELLRMV